MTKSCISIYQVEQFVARAQAIKLTAKDLAELAEFVALNANSGDLYYRHGDEYALRSLRWRDSHRVLYLSDSAPSQIYLLDLVEGTQPPKPPTKVKRIQELLDKVLIAGIIEAAKWLLHNLLAVSRPQIYHEHVVMIPISCTNTKLVNAAIAVDNECIGVGLAAGIVICSLNGSPTIEIGKLMVSLEYMKTNSGRELRQCGRLSAGLSSIDSYLATTTHSRQSLPLGGNCKNIDLIQHQAPIRGQ
jgi:hypothetical protein